MARAINRLSTRGVASLKDPGMYGDGGALYLRVTKGGSKQWVFVYQWQGRRRDMGLGGINAVSLSRAREKAAAARAMVADGEDPIAVKKAKAETPNFGTIADAFIKKRSAEVRSDKSIARFNRILADGGYASSLRQKRVDQITTEDVLGILQPIWTTKPETAAMARGYLENVLDAAKAGGYRTGDNPARWKGHLDHLLPARSKLSRGHHAAIPYTEIPALIEVLKTRRSTAALGLVLLILTAGRSGEVLGATWGEFDLKAKVWTIPANRMKAGKEHRVPLSTQVLDLLEMLGPQSPEAPILPGQKLNKPLSNMAFEMLLRRMNMGHFTAHGMRSAFRDWAGDETDHPREVAEAALAHAMGDAAEQAYRRGDALEKRRGLMEDWGAYCWAGGS